MDKEYEYNMMAYNEQSESVRTEQSSDEWYDEMNLRLEAEEEPTELNFH